MTYVVVALNTHLPLCTVVRN